MNVVVKKLLMKTLLLAPTSQTPLAQLKNWLSSASVGWVPVPVPVTDAVCGLFGALSVMISEPLRVPVFVGWKLIDMSQLVPGASVRPEQPSLTAVKSSGLAPLTCALLMNRFALPVLATVIDCAALVAPTSSEGKLSDDGVNVTAGAGVGVGDGDGDGDGDGEDAVHPDSLADAELDPSVTVIWQVDEL